MDESQLYKGIFSRSEKAFELVIDSYSKLLWVVVSSVLTRREDVEECVSDVFVDLWNEPKKFDPKKGSLKTFLVVKAKSKAIDKYRKNLKNDNVLDLGEYVGVASSDSGSGYDEVTEFDAYEKLYDAIRNLEEPNREILVRRFFLEEKPLKISSNMGLPIKEVENRLYRGKQQLKKALKGIREVFCL